MFKIRKNNNKLDTRKFIIHELVGYWVISIGMKVRLSISIPKIKF